MQQQKQDRIKNLQRLRELGFEPFGTRFPASASIKQTLEGYSSREGKAVRLAGRIMAIRPHGKAAFLDIRDWTGKIQVYIKKDKVPDKLYQLYEALDIGDIVGVSGTLFKTKTEEITILVEEFIILSKAFLPLPEKWHGLRDVELRYRKRYLDLISNPSIMEKFLARVEIIKSIRNFLDKQGFIEVETPMMQPLPGGATARPFITHHNTLDMDLYLRIAPELYLKRLLVGGMEKVYEINRNFRNEGISTQHNPEFTMLELYQAYGNYQDMMDLTEGLITGLVRKITPSLKLTYNEMELDFTPPWKRATYSELFQQYLGFSWQDKGQVRKRAQELQIGNLPTGQAGRQAGKSDEALAHDLFEKSVEPNLNGPIFVLDYPTAICPLTRARSDSPDLCERFELFIARMEIANAFTELNDPSEQRKRFERQLAERAEGAVNIDEDFINALEHGMPPAGGLGIGIDRLVMILTDLPSIRDVILFPTLRERKPEIIDVPPS